MTTIDQVADLLRRHRALEERPLHVTHALAVEAPGLRIAVALTEGWNDEEDVLTLGLTGGQTKGQTDIDEQRHATACNYVNVSRCQFRDVIPVAAVVPA